jgi:hypothetical protein
MRDDSEILPTTPPRGAGILFKIAALFQTILPLPNWRDPRGVQFPRCGESKNLEKIKKKWLLTDRSVCRLRLALEM